MGLFLSNLHIQRTNSLSVDDLKSFLAEDMASKGYTQPYNSDDGEIRVAIYAPKNSSWITVASDCFNFNDNNDTAAAAEPISERFCTSVIAMACMDSDYAFMHLINTAQKIDGWINSGSPYEGMKLPRRTSAAPWKSVVSSFEEFRQSIKEKSPFAEDVLFSTAEFIGMDKYQCGLEADRAEDLVFDPSELTLLYFSLPEGTKKELPVLRVGLYDMMPCRTDVNSVVFVNNKGGRSKGVAIRFVGDYIENDEVIIYDVTFESDYGSDKRKRIPIALEKRLDDNGNCILWWEDKNFQIPPAVNPALPFSRRERLEFEKQFGVRFFVRGNSEKFRDVEVHIIPLENPQDGHAYWTVKKLPQW
ncbi:MAG: hypothetical protein IJ874_07330 [Ruminococcus sp.]|nr:hypothetical protein [Ruminococcus sp.]